MCLSTDAVRRGSARNDRCALPGRHYHELDASHNPHIPMPQTLATLLDDVANHAKEHGGARRGSTG